MAQSRRPDAHGMEMDDSYVYVCGTAAESKKYIQVEESWRS
jgi:hypothetical protein